MKRYTYNHKEHKMERVKIFPDNYATNQTIACSIIIIVFLIIVEIAPMINP